LQRIVTFNDEIAGFWRTSAGWTPAGAQRILSTARLDWQVELSRSLRLWVRRPLEAERNAALVLGWANLGSLVEGSLKLIVAVWTDQYLKDTHAKRDRKGNVVPPDLLLLEDLKQFVVKRRLVSNWHGWIGHVQGRRNAIHSFKNRDLGTHSEFQKAVKTYLAFLRDVNDHLPYPEGEAPPREISPKDVLDALSKLRRRP